MCFQTCFWSSWSGSERGTFLKLKFTWVLIFNSFNIHKVIKWQWRHHWWHWFRWKQACYENQMRSLLTLSSRESGKVCGFFEVTRTVVEHQVLCLDCGRSHSPLLALLLPRQMFCCERTIIKIEHLCLVMSFSCEVSLNFCLKFPNKSIVGQIIRAWNLNSNMKG